MWKFLAKSTSSDGLTNTQFNQVYQETNFNWRLASNSGSKDKVISWYTGSNEVLKKTFSRVSWLVGSQGFEFVVYGLVGVNAALLLLQAALIETTDQNHEVYNTTVAMVFLLLYGVEMILRLLGLGVRGYMSCPWNVFDFLVTTTCHISMGLVFSNYFIEEHMSVIVILRLVRVLRLLRIKKG